MFFKSGSYLNTTKRVATLILVLSLSVLMSKPLFGQIFLSDDPIWEDPDQLNMPAPAEAMHSEYYDFYENTFLFPGKENDGPAQNVNSLGEVPNSAWYTNRHYLHPMSMAELLRGPDQGSGPAMTGKWEIIAGKTQGITPGFTIKDAKGDLYLIKFDPPGNPEMSTGAEMISTKLFYALGYSTPENYLINLHLGQLVLSPEATSSTPLGKTRPLTQEMVDEMLAMAHKDKSGHYRVLASKLLQGKPLGPFRYYGTRPDDANDIFPHETRRELRGLLIFCAWLNHDDSRSINTLDMLVTEEQRQFVRHYLIDFGSTLGSGSVFAQDPRAGNEYILESKPAIRSFLSFGFWVRPWAKVHYPDYPAIGRLEGDFFDPQKWKPEYPNPAFLNCDAEDAFWAARQVMNFTDQEIRAIVSLAQYSNPEAENYMVETLIKRRDKIGKAYLKFSGGLDKFRIEAGKWLVFEDLLSKYNLINSHKTRKITWRVFDNAMGESGRTLTENESKEVKLPIPSFESEFVVATIETPGLGTIQVFIRNSFQGLKIVGIKRK